MYIQVKYIFWLSYLDYANQLHVVYASAVAKSSLSELWTGIF